MACDVDELDINPFFRALQTRFSDLYNRAQEKCYMICIPQSTSIQGTAINKDFAETHILKPSPYFKGQLLTSHNGNSKTVTLANDGCSIITGDGFQSKLQAKIISEELAYNKEYSQYRILILDQPLDPKFQPQTAGDDDGSRQQVPAQCVSLAECRQFLHSFPEFSKALEKADHGIKLFNSNYMVLPDYLTEAAARLADISARTVEICIRCVGKQLAANIVWRDTLTAAMESYVMSGVHKKVFAVVSKHFAADDLRVKRKCLEQLKSVSPEALGVQRRFVCPLPDAVKELNRLNNLHTPREKLHCLKTVIDAMTTGLTAHLSCDIPPHLALTADKPCLTSDDLIPILVNVIGQSSCEQLQSDIVYMETFAWASSAKDMDDISYCLVTFKAAVQYILTTDFSSLPQKSSIKKQVSTDRLSSNMDRLSISNGSCKSPSPRLSPNPFSSSNSSSTTAAGGDRLDRQMSRVSRALEETSQRRAKEQEPKVKSIFGVHHDIPVETSDRAQPTPQLGDFLSSLQDDLMDQPFGKQA